MNKIGVVYHPLIEPAGKLAREIEQFLQAKNVATWVCSAWDIESVRSKLKGTDLLLTVGGDGTILRAAQSVVPGTTPITGINFGKLGFMTELSIEEVWEQITHILSGEGWIDERALLEVVIRFPEEEPAVSYYALNDAVIARGAIARLINIETTMNGEPLTTYKGDGLIVATATGSTGYALAAGGPILQPQAKEMVLVPMMQHLSANYPLVLPSDSRLSFKIQAVHSSTISIDGHTNLPAASGTVIEIKRSNHELRFLRIHPETYFYTTLERRLKGKL